MSHRLIRLLRPAHLALVTAISLLFGGCAAGGTAQRVTIAGGAQVMLPFEKGSIAPAREGSFATGAMFEFDKDKKSFTYRFDLEEAKARLPRRIRVEDVSDNDPVLLLDDRAPQFSEKGNQWHGRVGPCIAKDPRIEWIRTLGNSTRVYRITVEAADGRTTVLIQGAFYPGVIKSGLRQIIYGETY